MALKFSAAGGAFLSRFWSRHTTQSDPTIGLPSRQHGPQVGQITSPSPGFGSGTRSLNSVGVGCSVLSWRRRSIARGGSSQIIVASTTAITSSHKILGQGSSPPRYKQQQEAEAR